MIRPRLKTILLGITILVTLSIIGLVWAFWALNKEMMTKMEQKQFLRPTIYHAYPTTFAKGHLWTAVDIEKEFLRNHFRSRQTEQLLLPGDFFVGDRAACLEKTRRELPDLIQHCVAFIKRTNSAEAVEWLFLSDQEIIDLWSPQGPVPEVQLEPSIIAQYLQNEPLLQKNVELSDVPVDCMNAVLSIEDQNFLAHGGFSITGFLRAVYKNILLRQRAQGGSTITQQLVKNYFLSSERSFRRKAQELIMSILLESKFTKDEILQTYLNIIYMGQNGAFRVHGFAAASDYYFQKELRDLDLPECGLLAAILNSPGLFNPWRKSESSLKRRQLVLTKMKDLGHITPTEYEVALATPLTPGAPPAQAQETAPYYLDAVNKFLTKNQLPTEGVRIYTALDVQSQQKAQEALQKHLEHLEKNNKSIKAKKEKGLALEGAVLSGDARTGLVHILVGGRSFRKTQFNRAVDAHRQVGSIMKPFVFLAALMSKDPGGQPYTPTHLVFDETFTNKYDGQQWTPENYGKKYFGSVPLFFALKNSLNASTAKLGLEVGLPSIIEVAHELGIDSALKPLPSLTLGAFELYPFEVLKSYMALSQMGRKSELSYVLRVENLEGQILYEFEPTSTEFKDPAAVASLVSMMKQTILSGTAKGVHASGFAHPAAGKTGTTSDYRDTWFAGFTPQITTVVWVGYDRNEKTGLTGGSGAVPVWTDVMKTISRHLPLHDFAWPENVEKILLSLEDLKDLNAIQEETDNQGEVELLFKEGTR